MSGYGNIRKVTSMVEMPEKTREKLSNVVQRRREQLREAEQQLASLKRREADERASAFLAKLTPELIDLMVPNHGRTSCSDKNLSNGFCGDALPRCDRCALLDAYETGYWPSAFRVSIEIVRETD